MAREKKTQIIDSLQEKLSSCQVGILTNYQGLPTAEINTLRRKLRESGIDYKVVKNTLARRAARQVDMPELADSFEGPVAIAFGYGEVPEPARVLADYIRSTKSALSIKGGFLGRRVLTPREVEAIARLPARDVLISQVMAGIQSPIVALLSLLVAPVRGFMGVLQARMQQLEGEQNGR